MSFDVLAILFILFSVVSSLVNRFRTKRAEERQLGRGQREHAEDDEDLDAFDWGRLEEPVPLTGRSDAQPLGDLADDPGEEEVGRVLVEQAPEEGIAVSRPVDHASFAYDRPRRSRRGNRRRGLRFDRRAAIRGILYAEILGPPRSIRPVGENWE
jgi:hypothetical protein